MSTIYRYLDVLSVEKCIDSINYFIKIKRIFIIMSVMLYFLLYFASSKQKKHIICFNHYGKKIRFSASFTK